MPCVKIQCDCWKKIQRCWPIVPFIECPDCNKRYDLYSVSRWKATLVNNNTKVVRGAKYENKETSLSRNSIDEQ